MKRFAILLLALLVGIAAISAQPTIFLVRHAEKERVGDAKDPDLSLAGQARATIPEILRMLGVQEPVQIDEVEYDNLFVLVPGSSAKLLRLHYQR